jgi:hypothetical protein
MNDHIDLDWLFARCSPVPFCGCWLWTLSLKGAGYAQMAYGDRRSVAVHIVAYELKYGPVPMGFELDHLCRVRICINPDHLEPVPHRVNILRGQAPIVARTLVLALHEQRRQQTHCKRGHEFTPENTHIGKSGARFCLACRAIRRRTT